PVAVEGASEQRGDGRLADTAADGGERHHAAGGHWLLQLPCDRCPFGDVLGDGRGELAQHLSRAPGHGVAVLGATQRQEETGVEGGGRLRGGGGGEVRGTGRGGAGNSGSRGPLGHRFVGGPGHRHGQGRLRAGSDALRGRVRLRTALVIRARGTVYPAPQLPQHVPLPVTAID